MQNRSFDFGPVALTVTTTTNILNCNVTSLAGPVGFTLTQPYILLRHLRVINRTATAAFFALWRGTTAANAAGTEFVAAGTATAGTLDANRGISVPANSGLDFYGAWRFNAADFMVGGASVASALTIQGTGEIGFS